MVSRGRLPDVGLGLGVSQQGILRRFVHHGPSLSCHPDIDWSTSICRIGIILRGLTQQDSGQGRCVEPELALLIIDGQALMWILF